MSVYISTSLCNYALVSAYVPRYKRNTELNQFLTVLAKMKISAPSLLIVLLLVCETLQQSKRRSRWYSKSRYQAGRISGKECKDKEDSQETCTKVIKELGYQVCETKIKQLKVKLTRSCAKSCNFCGRRDRGCRYSTYGCCWDGATPRGNVYGTKGCPECKDHMENLCKRFKGKCRTNALLQLHCPKSCRRCVVKRMSPVNGQRVNIADWHKL